MYKGVVTMVSNVKVTKGCLSDIRHCILVTNAATPVTIIKVTKFCQYGERKFGQQTKWDFEGDYG